MKKSIVLYKNLLKSPYPFSKPFRIDARIIDHEHVRVVLRRFMRIFREERKTDTDLGGLTNDLFVGRLFVKAHQKMKPCVFL